MSQPMSQPPSEPRPRARDSELRDTQDVYRTLDLALRVGELLLSSGAGAVDVAAQMRNVGQACGLTRFSAEVTFTELAMSWQASYDFPAIVQLRQVRQRTTDYGDLTAVDHLIRDLGSGRIDRDEAIIRLDRIVSTGHAMPRWAATLGFGVFSAGVALMLRGTPVVIAVAFLAAIAIDVVQRTMLRRGLPPFFGQVAGGLVATLLTVVATLLPLDAGPGRVITASILLLLSGVSFVGAIQDALTNYPLTAGARILEAIFATAGAIAGVSGGISLAGVLGVDLGGIAPGTSALSSLPIITVGGGIVAAAYAFASYAPLRSLLPIGLVSAAATATYAELYQRGLGIAWASACGAFLVGLVGFWIAGRVRVPVLVVVVAGVSPLLPGLSIYRALSQLGSGNQAGLVSLVSAAGVAIALSSGVLLGQYVAQPLGREARRLETRLPTSRLASPRLVGPRRITHRRPR